MLLKFSYNINKFDRHCQMCVRFNDNSMEFYSGRSTQQNNDTDRTKRTLGHNSATESEPSWIRIETAVRSCDQKSKPSRIQSSIHREMKATAAVMARYYS